MASTSRTLPGVPGDSNDPTSRKCDSGGHGQPRGPSWVVRLRACRRGAGCGGRCAGRFSGWCAAAVRGRFDGAVRALRRSVKMDVVRVDGERAPEARRLPADPAHPHLGGTHAEPGGDDVPGSPAPRAPTPMRRCARTSAGSARCWASRWSARRGSELLDLVERVRGADQGVQGRRAGRAGRAAPAARRRSAADRDRRWSAPSPRTSTWPTCAEQVHRVRGFATRPADRGWLAEAVAAVAAAGRRRTGSPRRSARSAVRPVFTAHPTEASRRSILDKLRAVGEVLAEPTPAADADRPAPAGPPAGRHRRPDLADRRAAAGPPGPGRRGPQRHLLPGRPGRRHRAASCWPTWPTRSRRTAPGCDPQARPLTLRHLDRRRPGRQPATSPPRSPSRCCCCSTSHGIGVLVAAVDRLIGRAVLVSRDRRGLRRAARASLDADLAALPGLDPRLLRLNAEEPYRLKLSRCIRAKLVNTRARLAAGTAARARPGLPRQRRAAGRAAADRATSLRAHRGELIAAGPLAELERTRRRVRAAPGHDGRPRARRRPPPRRRPAGRPARRWSPGATPTCPGSTGRGCCPGSWPARRPLAPYPPRAGRGRRRAPSPSSPRSGTRSTASGPR